MDSETAKLTYDNQGGSGCTLCTPTKSGYGFDGWFTEKNGGGTQITENTTAY